MKFKRLMAMVMAVSLIVAFMPAFASAAPGGEEANANSTVTIRGTKALSAAAQFTVKEGLTSLNGYPVTYGDQYGERSIIVDLGTLGTPWHPWHLQRKQPVLPDSRR